MLCPVVLLLVCVGCGNGDATLTSGADSPTPTLSARPPSPAEVRMLTEVSSAQTVRLRVGQSVDVELPGGASGGYTKPTSSDGAVMHRVSSGGGYPTSDPARGRFTATATGRADLAATTDFTCLHSNPACLPPQRQWTVHIVVSA